jgi:hypothetical protein
VKAFIWDILEAAKEKVALLGARFVQSVSKK